MVFQQPVMTRQAKITKTHPGLDQPRKEGKLEGKEQLVQMEEPHLLKNVEKQQWKLTPCQTNQKIPGLFG